VDKTKKVSPTMGTILLRDVSQEVYESYTVQIMSLQQSLQTRGLQQSGIYKP